MIYGLKLDGEGDAESERVGGAGRGKKERSTKRNGDVFTTWEKMRSRKFMRYSSHTAPERNMNYGFCIIREAFSRSLSGQFRRLGHRYCRNAKYTSAISNIVYRS